ncbi:hypothetical protein [Halapricum salinum]|uniref:CARDB domain-containing protein n=1 Tax=Halapricum salinum TaxID=1457250 RepID=A0A4D6H8L5_9EURY|nr:hypothetical protein [Halapricum salinum]QCC49975.1 hypothetical protein DV733_01490 [Halapricum salinum]
MTRRWVYGGLVVLAISLLVSTGSFSTASADRDLDVTVADDASAFVGYDATCTNGTLSVTIANRFDSPISGSVTVDDSTSAFDLVSPGDETVVTVNSTAEEPVTVTVDGPETSVELDRTAPATC